MVKVYISGDNATVNIKDVKDRGYGITGTNSVEEVEESIDYDTYDCGCQVHSSKYKFGSAVKTSIIIGSIVTAGFAYAGVATATLPFILASVAGTIFIGGSILFVFHEDNGGCQCHYEETNTYTLDNGAVNKNLLLELEKHNSSLEVLEKAYVQLSNKQQELEKIGATNKELTRNMEAIANAYHSSKQDNIVDTEIYTKKLAMR